MATRFTTAYVFWHLLRVPNLVLLALGKVLTYIFLIPENSKQAHNTTDLVFIVLSTVLVAAGGYCINDYYDTAIDTINKPGKMVIGKHIRAKNVALVWVLVSFAGVLLPSVISLKLALINLVCVVLLWLYSKILKKTFVLGNIVVALLSATSIYLVGYYYQAITPQLFGYVFFSFLLSLIREIIKDAEDQPGDAHYQAHTIPVVLGIPLTKVILVVLVLLFFLLLVLLVPLASTILKLYVVGFIILPSCLLLYKLIKAKAPADFKLPSMLCKLIMLAGVLSMSLAPLPV